MAIKAYRPTTPAQRQKTTQDFTYGKDIRIFNLRERIMDNYQEEMNAHLKLFSAIYNRLSELEKDLAFAEIAGDNDKLLELEQEQQQLKNQQISLLSTIGLTPSDLVPKYNCEKCKDTGFIGSNHCDCF